MKLSKVTVVSSKMTNANYKISSVSTPTPWRGLCAALCGFAVLMAGCNPPTETIPRLKKRDRTAGLSGSGMSGSGITLGSGMTWSSGMTGSGITIGSGMTIRNGGSGITLPGGINFKQRFREMKGSGITLPQSNLDRSRSTIRVYPVSTRSASSSNSGLPLDGDDDAKAKTEGKEKSVKLQVADYDALNAWMKKENGKIIVLDVWSTSCIPCMKEFPELVALSQKFEDQVQCVALNVDYIGLKKKPAESYAPQVEKFLKSKKATFPNFLSSMPDEDIREKLGIFSIPAVLIYGTDGKLLHSLGEHNTGDDGLTYQGDVLPKIKAALAAR
ncbi:MAG: TlpA disulfide reductase family protein, partial [Pirellulaceae bacterium]